MNKDVLKKGMVVRGRAGFYDIHSPGGMYTAQVRGRLKQESAESDLVALGDWVKFQVLEDGSAVIEEVLERERVLSRKAPGREIEQVIIANPDQVILVFACADPDPNFRMLDRFLVIAERESIPVIICANKIDLVTLRSAKEEFGEYDRLGYPVLYTSATRGTGIRRLRRSLDNRISVLTGPSGAGKSSLLNVIQPGLGLETQEVRKATRKGQHTTVVRELLPLDSGGYVADTPGLKALALWDIEPEELDAYFREIAPLVPNCEFSDCTHVHEPGCAVLAAVENGQVSPERYDSYLRIRMGELEEPLD